LKIEGLKAGDTLNYSGSLLIMRDAAQKRMIMEEKSSGRIPVTLENAIVFYAGPAKTPEGYLFGAVGPTTSSRMDKMLEFLFQRGVLATIGKGKRTPLAAELCHRYGRAYFVAPSGAAAALMRRIVKADCVAYSDLGTEAVFLIEVIDFPLVTAIDCSGTDIFAR